MKMERKKERKEKDKPKKEDGRRHDCVPEREGGRKKRDVNWREDENPTKSERREADRQTD